MSNATLVGKDDLLFKASIVQMILERKTEEAIIALSCAYKIDTPKIKVGRQKRHKKVLGLYVPSKRTIFVANGDGMWNPFVILHEFYHHLRSVSGEHKGTEKYANAFAMGYIYAYALVNGNPAKNRQYNPELRTEDST